MWSFNTYLYFMIQICYLGHIEIEIMPCTPKGEGLGEDDFLDDPKELVM